MYLHEFTEIFTSYVHHRQASNMRQRSVPTATSVEDKKYLIIMWERNCDEFVLGSTQMADECVCMLSINNK